MPRLQLHLKPSKAFLALILFVLTGGLLSIFCCILPYYIQFLLGLAALGYGGQILRQQVLLQSPRAIVGLSCHDDNTWQLFERGGQKHWAFLSGASTRWAWLSVLRFSLEGGKQRSVVVFCDALDPGIYRQLLMKLATIRVY